MDAETPGAVGLLDENGRRERRRTPADQPLAEHHGALAFQLVLVCRGVAVRPHGDGLGVRLERDAVVTRARRWQPLRLGEDGVEGVQ